MDLLSWCVVLQVGNNIQPVQHKTRDSLEHNPDRNSLFCEIAPSGIPLREMRSEAFGSRTKPTFESDYAARHSV